jgi:1,4-alpha-glucan branching enzyme
MLSDADLHLFNEGTHQQLHQHLGAHATTVDGRPATWFGVWAPSAQSVSVIGDFAGWDEGVPLQARGASGIWEGTVEGAKPGHAYKLRIVAPDGRILEKADPFAAYAEVAPKTASVIWDLDHEWGDHDWMAQRGGRLAPDAPVSIYEVHLGSWRRPADDPRGFLGYRAAAPLLTEHCLAHGFTHVELLPIMEHPFYGSWGYQTTGYFAPTSRYGTPQDLMYLVDHLHQAGIGVILDWVPSHFPEDAHGLADFDGTHLFEHADPRQGFHPDWKSAIFNYGRNEVRSFLVSSALCWIERYHADGIRVDAVASMLYLDYSREEGEWIPNEYGGRENLEAIELLQQLNGAVTARHPDVATIAEESTAWPGVTRSPLVGGLGFGRKWDMGWMHDTLQYLSYDPIHRSYHHDELTFRGVYAFSERYVLPLSHDEVVHGKGSLLAKMPGDGWQQRANLRLLFGWMAGQPGKTLLFQGGELGQRREWDHESSIEWHLLDDPAHAGIARWVGDCNRCVREEPALHQRDDDPDGFQWVIGDDRAQSVFAFFRRSHDPSDEVLVVANATPTPREAYRIGVPHGGRWVELLNSDAEVYGGSGWGNLGGVEADTTPAHGYEQSVAVTLPPLGILVLRGERG